MNIENSFQPLSPDIQEQVRNSISVGGFRTLGSLALEHDVRESDLRGYLDSDPTVRRPWQQPVRDSFTDAESPVTIRERLAAVQSSISSRAPF